MTVDEVTPAAPILEVTGLRRFFPIRRGLLRRHVGDVRAVDGVSLTVHEGETLGIVGESGSGKTTLGRCIVRAQAPTAGTIRYRAADGAVVDLAALDRSALRPYRRELRMIFQDPYSSLNPRMTVRDLVAEPLVIQGLARGRDLDDRVVTALEQVGLSAEHLRRYPHAFSGGQRQRIGIARAIVLDSARLVVADEAVSALDVSVRAQILHLLLDLKARRRLTYIFISHDLGVVEYVADRVGVMYAGRIVEVAPTDALYHRPRHPYTEALLSAVPDPEPDRRRERIVLGGEVPDPADLPTGCAFHPRCAYATARCRIEVPALAPVGTGHEVACHEAPVLHLRGVAVAPDAMGSDPVTVVRPTAAALGDASLTGGRA